MPPIYIKHRINCISELAAVDRGFGVEIDLRSSVQSPNSIHLSHDPWALGDPFEAWLEEFKSRGIEGPIVLNTKEDGLEERALEMLRAASVDQYFFLDTALPTLVRWTIRSGARDFAVRLSRYEPLEGVRSFVGKADWAWVDCFQGEPLSPEIVARIKEKFRVCLVSPELQGASISEITKFKGLMPLADAICTKQPSAWEALS